MTYSPPAIWITIFFNHTIDHEEKVDSTDSHVCDALKLALAFTCQTGRRLHLWKVSLVKTFPFNTPNTTPIHTFARIVGKYYRRCLIWLTTSDRTVGSNSKVRREQTHFIMVADLCQLQSVVFSFCRGEKTTKRQDEKSTRQQNKGEKTTNTTR